ncbi:hypothetical protein LCGC14_1654290 [marine sediment metagenome]|uniref:Uncharacterized protein n=1 Tax=marine sediment metagenome TaxID=412755 RepID=A0A0F9HVX2_9ZZZZ
MEKPEEKHAEFFQELSKELCKIYKEQIQGFGEQANQPSVLSELLEEGINGKQ